MCFSASGSAVSGEITSNRHEPLGRDQRNAIAVDPRVASLRSDSRFGALLERMGLTRFVHS